MVPKGHKMASNGLKGLEIGLKSLQKWVKTEIYFQQRVFADQRLRKRGLFRPSLVQKGNHGATDEY